MTATLRLTVITGPHKDQRFCLRGPTSCLLGRASDCPVQLVGASRDQRISRHHCQFHVDLPCIHLEDLGSRNGTFINGKKVGELEQELVDAMAGAEDRLCNVKDGDVITVGGTSLLAEIVECPPPGIAVEIWGADEKIKRDCPVSC